MTDKIVLEAQKRTLKGKKVKALRRQGFLPGIIYGRLLKNQIDPIAIQLDLHEASKAINKLTGSSLVTLKVDDMEYPVVLREAQKDVIYGTLKHVDFMAVSLTEKLQTAVPIELIGQAPAEISMAAVVVTGISELEIECLPQDMPERIEVDATVLVDIDSAIYVRDLDLPDTYEVLTDPDELIAGVTYVTIEEEEEEEEEDELAELFDEDMEPEVIEKGKKDEDLEEEED
ncbi:MAG: 50S ribosomal protein L25 [Brevefilum sp.]|nr:50S ribosomal protein L25 [Brevefilum sp.]MDT8381314.1 50S ribosomal protein L25 [Brevefilum sp.]MDW7754295.1 50S ribosomal protein L25 [Brevefilum sp.]